MNNINNIIENINNQKQKQFSFDFYNYLKSCQPKPIRIYIMITIGILFLSIGDISFFSNFNSLTIVRCSLPQNNNNGTINTDKLEMTLDNCFYEGFKLTTCINNEFHTGSNYSLTFSVSKFGLPDDNKNKIMISFAFIIFLSFQSVYQPMQYFQFIKRKRIQDILAGSQIFINGRKKNEKILTIYFIVMGIMYILLKVVWFIYRYNQFSEISCGENGNYYQLQFSYTILSSLGTLLGSTIVYLLFPIIFTFSWINYLSELDFKKMTDHLSDDSIKEIKNIMVLDFKKYNKIIEQTLINRYQHESKINLFKRIHTFSFYKTSNFEIIEILLNYKLTNPQDFKQLLKNNGEDYHLPNIEINNNNNNNNTKNNNNYFRLN